MRWAVRSASARSRRDIVSKIVAVLAGSSALKAMSTFRGRAPWRSRQGQDALRNLLTLLTYTPVLRAGFVWDDTCILIVDDSTGMVGSGS
jgi:hypothetical protein